MEKRDASDTVAAPSDLDAVLFFTGPPPDNTELQPYVKIVEEKQKGRMKASGTISPPNGRKPTVSSYPPSDLDQALKSCGAPPPNTMLKPYVRVAESRGRLQARGTMCAARNVQDIKTSTSFIPMDRSKSAPKKRRWKANKWPPEPPKVPSQRPLISKSAEGLTSASTEKLPRRPKSRIKTKAVGLGSAATEDNLPRRKKKLHRRSLSDRSLLERKKKDKPRALKAPSSPGFWARLTGARHEPSFEERLAEQLSSKSGSVVNVGLIRETTAPSKDLIQFHARYGEGQQRLSTILTETLDGVEGALKPSDVKRLLNKAAFVSK